jgi:hypothetical protein
MNKQLLSRRILIAVLMVLGVYTSNAQKFEGLDEAPHDIAYYRESRATAPKIKVVYGRPQKKGEQVFGNKVAYGKVWRTGANEATEVKFYQDIIFGGRQIPAGTYVLYTIPGEKEWEVILNTNVDVLGSFQYDPIFDVARVTVPSKKAEELEAFSIAFKEKGESVQMVLGWDTTRVMIPIAFRNSEQYAKL